MVGVSDQTERGRRKTWDLGLQELKLGFQRGVPEQDLGVRAGNRAGLAKLPALSILRDLVKNFLFLDLFLFLIICGGRERKREREERRRMCMCLCVRVCMYTRVHVLVPIEPEGSSRSPGDRVIGCYEQLTWLLGSKLESSGRAVLPFNLWGISSASLVEVFKQK